MLARLFRPKWLHPDPQVRLRALTEKSLDAAQLARVADDDPDPAVFGAAIARLTDLRTLDGMARRGEDIRAQKAELRLQALLAGATPESPPLAERLRWLALPQPPDRLCALLCRAQEAEIRDLLLPRVDEPAALEQLVLTEGAVEARRKALERVTDEAALARLERALKGKHKTLYREAQQRLHALREHARAVALADSLVATARALGSGNGAPPDHGQLAHIDRQWRELSEDVRRPKTDAFAAARELLAARINESARQRAHGRDLLNALDQLLARLQREPGDPVEATAELDGIEAEWLALPDTARSENLRFAERLGQCREALALVTRDHERHARQRQTLDKAQHLLERESALGEADIRQIATAWHGLPVPTRRELDLSAQWPQMERALRQRLDVQMAGHTADITAAEDALSAMSEALDAEQLQPALGAADRLRQILKHSRALSESERRQFESAQRALQPRLAELKDWRRWGTRRSREELVAAAEHLAAGHADIAERVRELRQLRQAWREQDKVAGLAPATLKERFETACKTAHGPVADARRARREAERGAREQREGFLEEVRTQLDTLDLQSTPWDDLLQQRRDWISRWKALPPVPRPLWRNLSERFNGALEPLDRLIDGERDREIARRRALIDDLKSRIEAGDADALVNDAKSAQAAWNPSVRADRKRETQLWKEFRTVCDLIFSRRNAAREADRASRDRLRSAREAICTELESATVDEPTAIDALLRESEARWHDLASGAGETLQRRYERAVDTLRERADNRRHAAHRQALAQRLNEHHGDAPGADEHLEAVIRLEILAGLDSPPQDRERRLRLQVERLHAGLADRAGDAPLWDEAREIADQWLALPAVDGGLPLRQRFAQAWQAIDQRGEH